MNKQAIQQILAGDYWVHWTYTEEEWRDFAVHAWTAGRRNIPIVFGCTSLFIVACLLISSFLVVGDVSSALSAMAILLVIFLGVGGLLYGLNSRLYHRRLHQQERFVYISQWGIYRPEGFALLSGLTRVTLQQGMLRFRREKRYYNGKRSSKEIEVLVPHGQEEDARQLLERVQDWLARSR